MDTIELKFLLKLFVFSNYQTPLSNIQLNNKTKVSDRDKICRQLCDRGYVECSHEVTKLKIAPPGKALLKLNSAKLPVTDREIKVLRASEKEKITPGKTNVPAAQRQEIIQGLASRGLIEVETKIKEVWLSDRGKEYLRDEYSPKGSSTISLDMLNSYLLFLRKSLRVETLPSTHIQNGVKNVVHNGVKNGSPQEPISNSQPSDKEILQLIQDLDRQLGTENYLPIFHLRQKLETQLSREQLDWTLYRLQKDNQIELSTLQEVSAYTPEQVNSGIPQNVGGPLFFIIVN